MVFIDSTSAFQKAIEKHRSSGAATLLSNSSSSSFSSSNPSSIISSFLKRGKNASSTTNILSKQSQPELMNRALKAIETANSQASIETREFIELSRSGSSSAIQQGAVAASQLQAASRQISHHIDLFRDSIESNEVLSKEENATSDQRKHYEGIIVYLVHRLQLLGDAAKLMRSLALNYQIQSSNIYPKVNSTYATSVMTGSVLEKKPKERDSHIPRTAASSSSSSSSSSSPSPSSSSPIPPSSASSSYAFVHGDVSAEEDDDVAALGLSPEERKVLETENQAIHSELNSLLDEVREMEGKVLEVAQLSAMFSERVLEQAAKIETLFSEAVSSSEDIKAGNRSLKSVAKRGSTFRFAVLLFLFVASATLLFLDWFYS